MENRLSLGRLLIAVCTVSFGTGASCLEKDSAPQPDAGAPSSSGAGAFAAGSGGSAGSAAVGGAGAVAFDAGASDAGTVPYSGGTGGSAALDAAIESPDATVSTDAGTQSAPYEPGPAVQIVVNSGDTAQIAVSDGVWQRFYFDATVGQLYSISSLSGIVRGYVSTSPEVSATNHQFVTDADGDLSFVAPATARYYIAVVATGGGATGSFQVADGGTLLSLGSTSVTLDAPNGYDNWFFRFPVSAGQSYRIRVEGPIQPNVGLSVAPRPERRVSNGQLAWSIWGVGGSLPFDELIPAESVNDSKTGFYFFYLNVRATMTLTVTLTQGS